MEQLQFDHSLKDIPIPPKHQFIKSLLEKTERFLRRVRWTAFWIDNPDLNANNENNNYGFKSLITPPYNDELCAFEQDMYDMISSLKFREIKDNFQKQLSHEVSRIKNTRKIIVNADKTSNVYQMEREEYLKLLNDNITKHYQKAPANMKQEIDTVSADIAKTLKVDNRLQKYTTNNAYLTLKDHEPNFVEKSLAD